jgi:diguanylate cyclase (GGDEF)-like protein
MGSTASSIRAVSTWNRLDRSRWLAPALVSSLVCAFTVVLLPFGQAQLGPTVSFLPDVLAAVASFDVISIYLLVGDFRDTGDRRILATAWAYTWSIVAMTGYALAFPGVFATEAPLGLTPSVAPYLYIAWHAGFPLLLGLAWAPWPARVSQSTATVRRRRDVVVSMGVVSGVSVCTVALLLWCVESLPVLIDGLDTSGMTRVTAPIAIPLTLISLLLASKGLRGRTGPERWVGVAVLVCLCDLALTYAGNSRYSAGWYAGRSLTVVAAAVLLVAMLASFRRVKAAAEFNAAFDSLTGLANRRTADAALNSAVARSRRTGAPLSVLSIDLDHFKAVNDRHGHPAGDALLAATGATLREKLRVGDIPARVGGEEFLVLMPDTDEASARLVAERIRAAVAGLEIPEVHSPVTASLGIAHLNPFDLNGGHLLLRADHALYAAKEAGRNRVVCARPPARVRAASTHVT